MLKKEHYMRKNNPLEQHIHGVHGQAPQTEVHHGTHAPEPQHSPMLKKHREDHGTPLNQPVVYGS